MRVSTILDTIGHTPHVRLHRLFDPRVEVWMKLERANPGGSIKDRIALTMIDDAEQRGLLTKDSVIIEPTSGNTGIGLAMVAAVKGYQLVLVMPESMSIERRKLMAAYGATFDLTPREKGMRGAIERANELVASTPNAWMPNQFANDANIRAHALTTAREILADFPDSVDYLITGVGTGGHITACSEVLKQHWPAMKTFAVEPAKSAVISGGAPGPHRIQGVGPGFMPDNLHRDTLDGAIQVTEEAAFEYTQRAAREEGILVGISSGASLAAVAQQIPKMIDSARVLTFCYDTGERYLSIDGLFPV